VEVQGVRLCQSRRFVPVEPAGSEHTLQCIEDNTQVWFQIYGANLNFDDNGEIVSVSDGAGSLAAYYALCEAAGVPRPKVVVR
jgi:2,4'-dihydroxyacetophenone dioxygenase